MKKVLLAAFTGLSVMFMAASSGAGNSNKTSQISQTVSGSNWKYTGDSTKPDSPKYAMNVILADTTKDTTAVPKFVAFVQRMVSDTTKDTTKTGPKYYAIIEKLITDTTKDSTKIPKYDLAYNDKN
jgi:hypothetical protein